jgi:fluoroacetyl-CoA thioesterase
MKPELHSGPTHEIIEETLESHAAPHLAAKGKFLFSTPSMISFMERCSVQLISPYLDEGENSVGYIVNIKHLAATAIGQKVRVRSTIKSIDRRSITFAVEAYNETEKIGGALTSASSSAPNRHHKLATR